MGKQTDLSIIARRNPTWEGKYPCAWGRCQYRVSPQWNLGLSWAVRQPSPVLYCSRETIRLQLRTLTEFTNGQGSFLNIVIQARDFGSQPALPVRSPSHAMADRSSYPRKIQLLDHDSADEARAAMHLDGSLVDNRLSSRKYPNW